MGKFVHMELNTSDPKAAKRFYKSLFKWKTQDMKMPEGVYTMVMSEEGPIGGIQQHPMPGTPSAWLGYVGVDSVAKTMKKAAKLGGQVVVERMEVAGYGTLGIFADPTGAVCAVWEAAPAAPAAAPPAKKKAAKKAAKRAAKKVAKKVAKKAAKKAAKKK